MERPIVVLSVSATSSGLTPMYLAAAWLTLASAVWKLASQNSTGSASNFSRSVLISSATGLGCEARNIWAMWILLGFRGNWALTPAQSLSEFETASFVVHAETRFAAPIT